MKQIRKPFTAEQIEKLKIAAQQRIELRLLASELNVSRFVLLARAKELKIPLFSVDGWNPADETDLLKKYNEGYSVNKLSKHFHKNPQFIRKKLKVLGIDIAQNVFYLPLAKENAVLRKEGKFRCRYCKEVFDNQERVYKKNYCKPCQSTNLKEQYRKLKDNLSLDKLLKLRLNQSKHRAKQKNIAFNLTLEFLTVKFNQQNGQCFYSGLPMEIQLSRGYSVSIDRMDSSKGYTQDNVVLCCDRVNCMKHESSIEEMKELCRAILNHS